MEAAARDGRVALEKSNLERLLAEAGMGAAAANFYKGDAVQGRALIDRDVLYRSNPRHAQPGLPYIGTRRAIWLVVCGVRGCDTRTVCALSAPYHPDLAIPQPASQSSGPLHALARRVAWTLQTRPTLAPHVQSFGGGNQAHREGGRRAAVRTWLPALADSDGARRPPRAVHAAQRCPQVHEEAAVRPRKVSHRRAV